MPLRLLASPAGTGSPYLHPNSAALEPRDNPDLTIFGLSSGAKPQALRGLAAPEQGHRPAIFSQQMGGERREKRPAPNGTGLLSQRHGLLAEKQGSSHARHRPCMDDGIII